MNNADRTLASLANRDSPLVTIPCGQYEISQPVILYQNNQVVMAYGVSLRPSKDFVGDALVVAEGDSIDHRLSQLSIHGLRINGDGQPIVGFDSVNTFMLNLFSCYVTGCRTAGVRIHNAHDLKLSNCDIRNCGSAERQAAAVEISANTNGEISEGNTTWIDSCTIERYDGTGLRLTGLKIAWVDKMKDHGWGVKNKNETIVSQIGIDLVRCHSARLLYPLIVNCATVVRMESCRDCVVVDRMMVLGK